MSYSAWSVVFGEQPSAAKWNILGTNDASFHDGTGIQNSAITPNHRVGGFYITQWDTSALGTGSKTISGIINNDSSNFTPKLMLVLGHARASGTEVLGASGMCYYNGSSYVQTSNAWSGSSGGANLGSVTSSAAVTTCLGNGTVQLQATVTAFASGSATLNITTNTGTSTYGKVNLLFVA